MHATIIVRQLQPERIATLFDVNSVDEVTVNSAVKYLKSRFRDGFKIDTSQVDIAREMAKRQRSAGFGA